MRLKDNKAGFGVLWKLLIVVVLCLLGIGLYISPWGQKVSDWGKTGWGFIMDRAEWRLGSADDVMLVGHKRTSREAVLDALQIAPHQQMNTIDFDAKKRDLEKLPWVRHAIIERKLPNKLKITILEKTPIARWQNQGEYFLLDEEGKKIDDKHYLSEDLILIVGPDAPEHIVALLAALDQFPDIGMRVRSAKRIENRRWNLRLMDAEKGLEVLLPQTDVVQALARLERKNKEDKLLRKDIESIDMRLNDRIIVHPRKTIKDKKAKK